MSNNCYTILEVKFIARRYLTTDVYLNGQGSRKSPEIPQGTEERVNVESSRQNICLHRRREKWLSRKPMPKITTTCTQYRNDICWK